MALTPVRMATATLTTTTSTVQYTSTGVKTILKQILLANKTAAPVTATVVFVGIAICFNLSIPAYSTTVFDLTQVMNTGDTLVAYASANSSIDIIASGVTF